LFAGLQPVEARVVEVPDDLLGFESRDSRSTSQPMSRSGTLPKAKRWSRKVGRAKRSNARFATVPT